MERIYNKDCDEKMLSPLLLAFVGDAVFDLMVRERLVCEFNAPVGVLNDMKIKEVCCRSQSKRIKGILSELTEKEFTIFKRGRNAHTSNTPKNASVEEYHNATGLEALFGYVYLTGDIRRLRELFTLVIRDL